MVNITYRTEQVVGNKQQDIVCMDIHRLLLIEVEDQLPYQICDHVELGYTFFEIIHGFRGGTILQTYVRKRLKGILYKLLKPSKSITQQINDPGATMIVVR